MNRRKLLQTSLALAAGTLAGLAAATPARPVIEVWKTPTCGCCKDWIKHLQANGFEVQAHDVSNATKNDYRRRLGLADPFGSCHTALVNGYVLEGHVPAREIERLLNTRPRALGLAVPGMPIGSPGMDGPEYGGQKDAYDVLLVQRGGTASVFRSYR
jgi:hypothetical protein